MEGDKGHSHLFREFQEGISRKKGQEKAREWSLPFSVAVDAAGTLGAWLWLEP